MGFDRQMVEALLENEDVEDTNQAVDMLIKGPNGWTHKFWRYESLDIICRVCGEQEFDHANMRQ